MSFAGTQDRVVLIQGTAEGLVKVHTSIIEKVHDFPVPKDLAALIGDRPNQVGFDIPLYIFPENASIFIVKNCFFKTSCVSNSLYRDF